MVYARILTCICAATQFLATVGPCAAEQKSGDLHAQKTFCYIQAIKPSGVSSVVEFQQNADGTLSPLTPPSVATGAFPYSLTVDPAGKNLYAALWVSPGSVQRFKINDNGTLTGATSPAIARTGSEPYPLAFTPDGTIAVAPNNADGTISAYRVAPSGDLTLVNTVATGPEARSVVIDSAGRYAYAANFTGDSVTQYSIGPDGLKALGSAPTGENPYALTLSPSGKYLYSANRASGSISEFSIDASTGALKRIGSTLSGTGSGSNVNWITFDSTGRFAYVSDGGDNAVTQFKADPDTGLLSPNGGSVRVGAAPVEVAVDPSGKYLYVANSGDNSFSQLIINPDGTLSSGETAVIAGKTHSVGGSFVLPASPWTIAFVRK